MEYIIKSMLCLVLLLLVHRIFLQRETIHQFNRFFLLGAVVFSFFIPFNSIEVAPEKEEIAYSELPETDFSEEFVLPEQSYSQENFTVEIEPTPEPSFPWEEVLWSIYSLITFVLLVRFIRNINLLMDQVKQNLKVTYKGMTLVLLPSSSLPYTFLNYVFVFKEDFQNGDLEDAIIEHEHTHVKEGHSYDILFLEVLLIPFWFNPGLYLAKHAIRLNHEFIADQNALKTTSVYSYQKMLLALASQEVQFSLVSNLNFSLTKKRLKMMKQQSNPLQKWIKLIVLIPVLGALVYVFSEKVSAKEEQVPNEFEVNLVKSVDENLKEDAIYFAKDGTFRYHGKEYSKGELTSVIEELKQKDLPANIVVASKVKMSEINDVQKMLRDQDIRRIRYSSLDNNLDITPESLFEQYNDLYSQYEELRNTTPHFIEKSIEEQHNLEALYSELGSIYFKIPLELKGLIKRPTPPFAPFLKLKKDDEIYYKLAEDLTVEEKRQLPPAPTKSSDPVETYHQLFLKYEWLRMEGRKYSNKSQDERALMFELYNGMQEKFMAMNPIQRRQVKRVNFPFIPMLEDDQLTFKVLDEMTPEQRALAGC